MVLFEVLDNGEGEGCSLPVSMVRTEKNAADSADSCLQAVRIEAVGCPAYLLSWDAGAYQFEPVNLSADMEPAAGQNP